MEETMKNALIFAVFSLLAGSSRADAWSYGEFISCNALNPMPAVTFKTSYGQLVHDFNLSTDEITAKASGAEKGFFVDGLARVGTRSSFRLRRYTVRRLDAGAPAFCRRKWNFSSVSKSRKYMFPKIWTRTAAAFRW